MSVVKVQLVHPNARLPEYAHAGDAGLDLFAVEEVELGPGEFRTIHTGLVIELPAGTEGQVRPRSGLAAKHGVTVLNTPGTIDHGYRGEVGVILINHGNRAFHIEPGMKIAQLVIAPIHRADVVSVQQVSATSRNTGGFGSTGL
jgi:dUTP pyrophosphatase